MRMSFAELAESADVFAAELFGESELVEVPGFFGANNVRRTEAEVRAAVVARANAEWTAWHTAAGAPRSEGEAAMFGRLVGYYAAALGSLMPDTLTAVQAKALTESYTALLAAGASATTIATEATRLAGVLLTGAPGATASGVTGRIADAIQQAREAHANSGDYSAWSAAYVTACVRGAGITLGLEVVIPPGRRQVDPNPLLLASLTHAGYTIEARSRRAATTPRHRGTYHAFTPRERAPRPGDIIVQDRRPGVTAAQITALASLGAGLISHGDIVVDVQPGFVIAVGGNLGDSCRRRRYPRDAQGLLVIDPRQLFTQEDSAGALPALPLVSALPLAGQSTARVFALLSPIEELAAVPGQPVRRWHSDVARACSSAHRHHGGAGVCSTLPGAERRANHLDDRTRAWLCAARARRGTGRRDARRD